MKAIQIIQKYHFDQMSIAEISEYTADKSKVQVQSKEAKGARSDKTSICWKGFFKQMGLKCSFKKG